MINIRYHIVSITAIFLALGIGTLLGSTFLDRATVDQLDKNIRNAETRIHDTERENDRLQALVDEALRRDEALIEASETTLEGQLTDRPVLLVVAPGVETTTLDTLRQILANADADLRGSLLLREELGFAEGVDGELAETLDLDEDDPEAARDEVLGLLVDALVAAGTPVDPEETPPEGEEPDAGTTTTAPGDPGTSTTTTTTAPADGGEDGADDGETGEPAVPDGRQPDILTALIEADLVGLDPGPADGPDSPVLETAGYQYVYVTQPDLDPAADELLVDLLPAVETEPPLPAVVVSPTVPEPEPDAEEPAPTAVAQVRADPARSDLYDTVDDIETYLGLQSTVILLRTEGAEAGHYGQGEGATALAPGGR
ncbi:MAG TPA: copper transporter [Iamia sp.]